MSGISSNTAVAGQIATRIAGSLDGLNRGGVVIHDTQTTVAGNESAQEAIQAALNAQNKILQTVGQASKNLQSVANEFEAADQKIQQLVSALPISQRGGR